MGVLGGVLVGSIWQNGPNGSINTNKFRSCRPEAENESILTGRGGQNDQFGVFYIKFMVILAISVSASGRHELEGRVSNSCRPEAGPCSGFWADFRSKNPWPVFGQNLKQDFVTTFGRPQKSVIGALPTDGGVDQKWSRNPVVRFWAKTGHGFWAPVLAQNRVQGRPPNAPSRRRLSGLECWGGGVPKVASKRPLFKWTLFPQYTPFENRFSKGVYWVPCTSFWAKKRDHFSVVTFWPKNWAQNRPFFAPFFFFFFWLKFLVLLNLI